jgi:hypothetical protein
LTSEISPQFVLFTVWPWLDLIKVGEMGWACSNKTTAAYKIVSRKPWGESVGVGGRTASAGCDGNGVTVCERTGCTAA